MTNLAPGRHTRGQLAEISILGTEARIDEPRPSPICIALNAIARDAIAAALRDDAQAVANLPTGVTFRAAPVRSDRYPGRWRLLVVAKAEGKWGHCMSGPIDESVARGLVEMINGPAPAAPVPAAATATAARLQHANLIDIARQVIGVDVLGRLASAFCIERRPAGNHPSAAGDYLQSQSNANTASDLPCASPLAA